MTVGSLFAGIGGFDLAAQRVGWDVKWQVEIDPFCRKVLAKHWPHVERFEDVRTVGAHNLQPVDVICGGFPCQPVSIAGHRKGDRDERWLWPELARVIRVVRPRFVVVENVPGLLGNGFGAVLGDLADLGFDAEWDVLPASQFGAPHLRRRVWLIAYPSGIGGVQSTQGRSSEEAHRRTRNSSEVADPEGVCGELRTTQTERPWGSPSRSDVQDSQRARLERHERQIMAGARIWRQDADITRSGWWATEPDVGRVAHGVPARVDRLRGLGNAIVPQIAEWIFRQIQAAEDGVAA